MGEFPDNITEFHISSGKSGEFPDECALLRGEEERLSQYDNDFMFAWGVRHKVALDLNSVYRH